MKLLKWLLIVVAVVVALLVMVGVAVAWRADALVRRGVESGATYALGVPTTLDEADVGILGGTLELDDLRVANPPGFASEGFLSLGESKVAVTLGSLMEDTIVVPELRLTDIDVSLERKEGKTNYAVLLENLEKVSGPGEKDLEPAAGSQKKLVINLLQIDNVTVRVDLLGGPAALGELTKVVVPIDQIRLTDVGKTGTGVGGTGVTVSELTSIVVQAVLAAAAEKGGDLIPADLLGDLRGRVAALGDLDELGMSVIEDARSTVDAATKKLDETVEEGKKKVEEGAKKVEETVEGLKDLFPGRKEKDGN